MAILARRAGMLGCDGAIVMQERPALAFGLLSVLLGAVLAAWQAAKSFPRRQTLRQRFRHGRRQVKAALDLPALALKLLANPILRGYLRRTVMREVSRRLGR